ncbi:hypothetical protein BCR34DRAFT_194030 [Clohesyomyces aquaticus]|uniref:Uncharacterized protein n=1 Tax=Clohesyomyces aquaticus TaxID=1231657 RepID=A0A1Y1YCQ0_9PLEO|nr:hypothetical protein BCR34DRAFT_194030 [Clohesyomyces aquaticus]
MSNATSPSLQQSGPLTGLSVFWPLLTLALACCLHPLGSACGESSPLYRYHIRALPLSGLLDSLHFLWCCFHDGSTSTVIVRLYENDPDMIVPDLNHVQAGGTLTLDRLDRLLDFMFDLKIRVFPNIFIVLVYTKLCTFNGVPWSLTIGTVYFLSWLLLESILMAELFLRRRRGIRERVNLESQLRRTFSGLHERENVMLLRRLRFVNCIVIVSYIIALLVVFIISIVQRRAGSRMQQPQPPTQVHSSHPTSRFDFSSLTQLLFTPLRSAKEMASVMLAATKQHCPTNQFYAFIYNITFGVLVFLAVAYLVCTALFANCLLVCIVIPAVVFYTFLGFVLLLLLAFNGIRYVCKQPSLLLRSITFLLLGGSLLYYIKFFDPTGTSKRAWSDVLG